MIATVIVLTLLGITALVIEVFLPGGILGVLGGLAVTTAVVLVITAPPFTSMGLAPRVGLATLIVALAATAFATCMRTFQSTFVGKRLTLDESIPSGSGVDDLHEFVGRRGTAVTDLLPGGRVEIDGRRLDAVSRSGAVRAGDPVEVTGTNGAHLEITGRPEPADPERGEVADRPDRA